MVYLLLTTSYKDYMEKLHKKHFTFGMVLAILMAILFATPAFAGLVVEEFRRVLSTRRSGDHRRREVCF